MKMSSKFKIVFQKNILIVTRRKKEARIVHKRAEFARKVHGLKAKLHQKKRYTEKVTMKKT